MRTIPEPVTPDDPDTPDEDGGQKPRPRPADA